MPARNIKGVVCMSLYEGVTQPTLISLTSIIHQYHLNISFCACVCVHGTRSARKHNLSSHLLRSPNSPLENQRSLRSHGEKLLTSHCAPLDPWPLPYPSYHKVKSLYVHSTKQCQQQRWNVIPCLKMTHWPWLESEVTCPVIPTPDRWVAIKAKLVLMSLYGRWSLTLCAESISSSRLSAGLSDAWCTRSSPESVGLCSTKPTPSSRMSSRGSKGGGSV